uniref:Protein kinase domain-containing protein n=1 Tax=Anopheles quadriannulatus TaxID=34691 RepID=A0A182X6V7_ANOQN
MSLVQGGAAGAPQGAILAAAAPYFQPPAVPQDVQPDRPIGYGAFGVVCKWKIIVDSEHLVSICYYCSVYWE